MSGRMRSCPFNTTSREKRASHVHLLFRICGTTSRERRTSHVHLLLPYVWPYIICRCMMVRMTWTSSQHRRNSAPRAKCYKLAQVTKMMINVPHRSSPFNTQSSLYKWAKQSIKIEVMQRNCKKKKYELKH